MLPSKYWNTNTSTYSELLGETGEVELGETEALLSVNVIFSRVSSLLFPSPPSSSFTVDTLSTTVAPSKLKTSDEFSATSEMR